MKPLIIPYSSGQVAVLADLHLDHYARQSSNAFTAHHLDHLIDWRGLDALIIAGDVVDDWTYDWSLAITFLTRFIAPTKIYIIPGNHDFYTVGLDEKNELRLMIEGSGAHFIQMSELQHGTSRILSCTLWTDFALIGTRDASMAVAARNMLDYERITKSASSHKMLDLDYPSLKRRTNIEPADTLEVHHCHRKWLDAALGHQHFAGASGKTVVVTHHGPHPITAGPINAVSAAFHSDLEALILRHQPDVWFFGHSHWRLRGSVGKTDIRNVSVGYPNEQRIQGEHPLEDMCIFMSDPLTKAQD